MRASIPRFSLPHALRNPHSHSHSYSISPLPPRTLSRRTIPPTQQPPPSLRPLTSPVRHQTRPFNTTTHPRQKTEYNTPPPPPSNSSPRYNFYKTHSRAFLKSFTLAFLTFQVIYWTWLTLETEEIRDAKEGEIRSLQGELRLLEEGRRGHAQSDGEGGMEVEGGVEEWEKRVRERGGRRKGGRHRGFVDAEGDVDEGRLLEEPKRDDNQDGEGVEEWERRVRERRSRWKHRGYVHADGDVDEVRILEEKER